jgi:hypothetical protein
MFGRYYEAFSQDFSFGQPVFLPIEIEKVTSIAAQREMRQLAIDLSLEPDVDQVSSWLTDFYLWVRYRSSFSASLLANNFALPAEMFLEALTQFLNDLDSGGWCHRVNVELVANGTAIGKNRYLLYLKPALSSYTMQKQFKNVTEFLSRSNIKSYAANPFEPIVSVFDGISTRFLVAASLCLGIQVIFHVIYSYL